MRPSALRSPLGWAPKPPTPATFGNAGQRYRSAQRPHPVHTGSLSRALRACPDSGTQAAQTSRAAARGTQDTGPHSHGRGPPTAESLRSPHLPAVAISITSFLLRAEYRAKRHPPASPPRPVRPVHTLGDRDGSEIQAAFLTRGAHTPGRCRGHCAPVNPQAGPLCPPSGPGPP